MRSGRISRRQLGMAGAATIGSLAIPAVHIRAQDEQKVLRILGWSGYFGRALTAPFRETHNCRIEVTGIATSDDTMLFLRAGGIGLYDIVAPTIGLVNPLGAAGLLAELDIGKIGNFGKLFPEFQELPQGGVDNRRFGIPLLWGTMGLVANTTVSDPPMTWLDLQDPDYTNRLTMPDDGLNQLALWNWALGADDPMRVSRVRLGQTVDTLIGLKQQRAVSFGGTVYDTMMQVANGLADFSTVGWQSAPLLTNAEQQSLVTTHPEPGGVSFCDCIAMGTDSHDPELAQQFIDFMLSSDTQRNLIDATRWATVSDGVSAMIEPEIAALYSYDALDRWLTESPIRGYPPLGDDGSGAATYVDWILGWDRVRQAQL